MSADEAEVEFGIVLGAEIGAVIAKGTAEVHFTVTLSWKQEPGGMPRGLTVTDPSPGTFIARILGPGGRPVGLGALVTERHLVTCALVVNAALGLDARQQGQPTQPVVNGHERVLARHRPQAGREDAEVAESEFGGVPSGGDVVAPVVQEAVLGVARSTTQ